MAGEMSCGRGCPRTIVRCESRQCVGQRAFVAFDEVPK
jgi:hypothetical protein